jgi:hypothetical protein
MALVNLVLGTRKAVFVLERTEKRERRRLSEPFVRGMEVNYRCPGQDGGTRGLAER